jgi:hypothetical protein
MRLGIYIVLLCAVNAFAQRSEGGLLIENDLFTSSVNDKYYTNGVELYYRHLGKNTSEKTIKKIDEVRFGQYIYNPQTVLAANPDVHDRPFAGYLFGQYAKSWFYRNESVLKIDGQLGVVGPSSGAEGLQELFHDVFNYDKVYGWKYQVHNTTAMQLGAFYSRKIFRDANFDMHIRANAVAGTAFNSASISIISRISLTSLLPLYDSALYGAAVNPDPDAYKQQSEFFFYFSPGYNYQFYDATIQGSMFNDDSPITWGLIPWRFAGEAGLKYRKNHLNLLYAFVYRGKEVDNFVNTGYFYGSISASWLF